MSTPASSPQDALFSLLYVSEMEAPSAERMHEICRQSRHNNERDDITGVLVFDGRGFCQFVEGPEVRLRALLERLERDGRHRRMRVLRFGEAARRRFPTWRLGYAFSADASAIEGIAARRDDDAIAAFDLWLPALSTQDA
jgi:hypothetical protein